MNRFGVRRDHDGELLGFVSSATDGGWRALTVSGAELCAPADRDAALQEVDTTGLAALAERWWFRDGGEWLPAVIQEAGPGRVVAVVVHAPRSAHPMSCSRAPRPGPTRPELRRRPA